MARERTDLKADDITEQCLAVHYAVSRVLAEATSLDDAVAPILQAIGTGFHWSLTALWRCDLPPQRLRYHACWPVAADGATSVDENSVVAAGATLPERVLSSGEPVWSADIADDAPLLALAKAAHAEAHWAVAFPIRDHGATLGVIAGFNRRAVAYDGHLARTFALLGTYIGQFIAPMPATIASQTDDARQHDPDMAEALARAGETDVIFDALVDSVTVYDHIGKLVRANPAARELFRLDATVAAKLARPYAERGNFYLLRDEWGEPLPRAHWPLRRLLDGESLIGADMADIILTTIDGRTLHLCVSGAPIFDHDGAIRGAVMITRDVGERRKLERQTHDSLHALLEMAKTLVQVSETDIRDDTHSEQATMFTKARRIAAHLAEATRHMFECRHVSITAVDPATDMLHPLAVAGLPLEQERLWWQKHAQAVPLDRGDNSADVQRFRNGEVLLIDMTQPPYRDLPNVFAASAILVVAMKIGERIVGVLSIDNGAESHHYSAEEIELAGAVAKLAALVMERERLLREREEARANELALGEANRRMDEFLSIASHELKTPLTSVKGYIQLATHRLKRTLSAKPDGEDLAQFVLTLQGAIDLLTRSDYYSDVLNRLVTELLDVSRIQANTSAVRRAPCNLAGIVTEAVKAQRLAAPERDISLTLAADLDATIHADGERISQVITNLLTNALTYSAADRPVAVTMHRDDDHITVAVRDEGPGVPADEQQHIWERFYRGAGQRQYTGSGGLGIGLYISRTIIEQHEGQIGVHSTVGAGATFWFALPVASA